MMAEHSAGAVSHLSTDWHSINWNAVNETVRRLQARIVKATKEGKWHKVHALQHLLTHSFSGKALAVRRVTENQGKNTPGVDKVLWKDPESKGMAIHQMQQRGYKALPLRRVYIPKPNGKKRPLGIPTMKDRAMQALHLQALAPIAETLADPNSYGFRKERSCADAMEQCATVLSNGTRPQWILEGDIKSCFDKISHPWLLNHIPMDKTILNTWLKAGYMDKSVLHETEDGTPQGGIISPVLANMALDGLERILRKKYPNSGRRALKGMNKQVNLVRYADDFIITGISKEILENEVKPLVTAFLWERGLELSEEKTSITHIEEGFDFLGQTVRKYNGKFLTRPSKKNVKTFLTDIRKVIKDNKEASAYWLIATLNPKIRGWANFHRHAAAKKTFVHVDAAIFKALWRWARRRHPKKSKWWVKDRYFGRVGNQNWRFFGQAKDKDGKLTRNLLCLASATPITRYKKIKGKCNPYDPTWELYLETRHSVKMEQSLHGRRRLMYLWKEQGGICPVCNQPITQITGWHNHHIVYKTLGGTDNAENRVLIHPNCHKQVHAKNLTVSKPRPVKAGPQAQPGALFHA
ncbi:MAG TPA: group II intron reverse transcriptase/maturase [Anaerolineales bacterium]